jgi:CBS domain-containing protein
VTVIPHKPSDELTAGDLMQAAVRTVPSNLPLPKLEELLMREKISGVPVVDDGELVGLVSRSDVVRQLCTERTVAETISDFHFDESGFYEVKMASLQDIADRVGERIEGLRVRDVMIKHPLTVQMDAPVAKVAEKCVEHRVHRLPVLSGRTLVGIVTTMDLIRLIAR